MQIMARRIRPLTCGLFVVLFFWLLSDERVATDEIWRSIGFILVLVPVISFLSLYFFPLWDRIVLTEEELILDLKKHYYKVQLSSIKNISFGDTKNELYLKTDFSEATFDISRFRKGDIDKLFKDNNC